ncbi:MAG: hypothetical protein JXB47_19170 [Anaerolineae bacterium]|nr:hypothetical protein [Anaerolineae bacterium]
METKSIVDRVLGEIPALKFTVAETAFEPTGGENLVHYLTGTQEPWSDKPGARTDFLLRGSLLGVHRVTPSPDTSPGVWVGLVTQAQAKAQSLVPQAPDGEARLQLLFFNERTRSHESKQQIQQRVWLALVMFNLGERGLRFDPAEGAVLTESAVFGAPVGAAPDDILEGAGVRHAGHFYVVTFAERVRGDDEEGEYPVELAKGRGRMRWYVHQVRLASEAAHFLALESEPIHRRIALVVAGEEHATRPSLPRDYYRDAAFQQAVIDAEDGDFDMTLVLSPRYHVVTLDQTVSRDHTWKDLVRHHSSPWFWSVQAAPRLWQICLEGHGLSLDKESAASHMGISWEVWRHPESHYEFTFFGLSHATHILSEFLHDQHTEIDLKPGYMADETDLMWDELGEFLDEMDLPELDESLRDELQEALAEATEHANLFSQTFFMSPPPGLDIEPYILDPEEALEPVMVLLSRESDVDEIIQEGMTIQDLLEGEPVTFNILVDAPLRLRATLDIIHAIIHQSEDEVFDISNQVLPPPLDAVVHDSALPLADGRLCPLLTFAEALSALTSLLSDDDRDRLNVWQRTFWAGELRHRARTSEDADV